MRTRTHDGASRRIQSATRQLAREAQHPLAVDIKSAEFVISNTDVEKCPAPDYPEYAFIGRSNVGKSSLINMLTGRNGLARISKKPGKTLEIKVHEDLGSCHILPDPCRLANKNAFDSYPILPHRRTGHVRPILQIRSNRCCGLGAGQISQHSKCQQQKGKGKHASQKASIVFFLRGKDTKASGES